MMLKDGCRKIAMHVVLKAGVIKMSYRISVTQIGDPDPDPESAFYPTSFHA